MRQRTLACILSNPPTTSGARTLARLDLAREALGFETAVVANLFVRPSRRTGEIRLMGTDQDGWLEARPGLAHALCVSDAVLFAFGVEEPSGQARVHFREQLGWMRGEVSARQLTAYQVGDGPRHPSRWQRWTYRAHPDVTFPEAVRRSLVTVSGHHPPHNECAASPEGDGLE
jgi:hypothetical protein